MVKLIDLSFSGFLMLRAFHNFTPRQESAVLIWSHGLKAQLTHMCVGSMISAMIKFVGMKGEGRCWPSKE